METFSDFEDEHLPSLDFEIGLVDGEMRFRFFEEEMKSKWVTPADSTTSLTNKMNWTSNDLGRRLLRGSDDDRKGGMS